MEEVDLTRCVTCAVSEEERRLVKCLVCHKRFCEECAVRVSGRTFCSRGCGEFFFRDEEEDA